MDFKNYQNMDFKNYQNMEMKIGIKKKKGNNFLSSVLLLLDL